MRLGSTLAQRILDADRCNLDFEERSQGYSLPCQAVELRSVDSLFQSTYWHNSLFYPALPGQVRVLCFHPDWDQAQAPPR